MKFYVDYDDCICETARAFTGIADGLFGKVVPYEEINFFNLKESFELSEEQYDQLMVEGHRPEVLLSYEETSGASDVLNVWLDMGHEINVITGRPSSTYEPSRLWLDEHGLERVKLFCLNKYGRDTFIKGSEYNLELEDYYKMRFDYAIEDSPMAFRFFEHLPDVRVMLFDRPWNRGFELTNNNHMRCSNWEEIRSNIQKS